MKKVLFMFVLIITFGLIGSFFARVLVVPENIITSKYLVESLSKNELIYRADLIVRGTVKYTIGSEWTNPGFVLGKNIINEIRSYVTIEISEVYKGDPVNTQNIIVYTNGGQIGKTVHLNNDSPKLTLGEQVILFLYQDDEIPHLNKYPIENSYGILGFKQGKYLLYQNDLFVSESQDSERIIDQKTFRSEIEYGLTEYPKVRKPGLTREEIAEINRKTFGD